MTQSFNQQENESKPHSDAGGQPAVFVVPLPQLSPPMQTGRLSRFVQPRSYL